ncbi:InlB B-repeat-containing protein, partial [Lachnospiraceae bacterium CLA-AA-H215]|nr:InlB B-repeat-containing protein [Hominifimenecus microfluidus]
AAGGVDYILRAPSVGSGSIGSAESQRGTPPSNEWDRILDKNDGYIKNWFGMFSWGQDTLSTSESDRAARGYFPPGGWSSAPASHQNAVAGFRPVLEVLSPGSLGSDGLKAVTLDLGGGKLGDESSMQIIVETGSAFTAPTSDGLTRPDGNTGSYFMWRDNDGQLYAPGDNVPADVTKLTAQFNLPEQFTLAPGGTYYFDLSGAGIPGTANDALPDATLHYVPFTYAGMVNAYKLTSAMETTEEYAEQNKYDHSLFVAEYNVTRAVSWIDLNTAGLIFGKDYTSDGVDYTLRAPSVGSASTGSYDLERGTPQSNEWDKILDKGNGYIKNWEGMESWGQDIMEDLDVSAHRGHMSARYWNCSTDTFSQLYHGFRPVLEVLGLDTLGADGLKAVTLDLGDGKLGVESSIQIIVIDDSTFTAPASDGLTRPDGNTGSYFMWLGSDGKLYDPGDNVPADVTKLTAQFASSSHSVTITTATLPDGKVGEAYSQTLIATGTTPITWSIIGALPDGLSLNKDTGKISGTPTADGTAKFTVTAENSVGSDTKELSITITKAPAAEYTVTVTTEGGGTASASPAKAVAGAEITLTAMPNEGYHFKEWQVISGGVSIKNNKFTMPNNNVEVKAIFEEDTPPAPTEHTVTVTSSGNGTASASPAKAVAGAEITLSATPDKGYHLKEWQVISGNVTIKDDKFLMPDSNVEIKAIFEKDAPPTPTEYTVTVTSSGNGTASASPSKAVAGAEITLTATPDKGYHLKEWQVESPTGLVITNNKFTMPDSDVEVKAVFEEDAPPAPTNPAKPSISVTGTYTYNGFEHTATVSGYDPATMDISGNTATDAGDYIVSVTSKTGKWADGSTEAVTAAWSIGKATQEAPNGLICVAPTTEGGSDGKITGVTDKMEYRMKAEGSYTPCSGAEIENLSAGDYFVRYAEDNNHFASPDAAVTVGDGEPLADCTITFNGNGGSGNMDSVTAKAGTNYILPACGFTAPTDQEFKAWQIGGTEYKVGDSYTVNGDTEIKALWENSVITPTTYTVTVGNDGNGTGTATPSAASAGTEITLTATPNTGYHLKEWKVISGDVTITNDKFLMPNGNVEVKAIFEEDAPPVPTEFTITVKTDGNGTASASLAKASAGTEITLTATPKEGYRFKEWEVISGGVTIKDNKFTMPNGNVGVKAIFEKDAPPAPTELIVTFDGNGGTPSVGSMTTTDQKLPSLPNASRSGSYSFDGWYTEKSGGTKITTDTVFHANTTVYAHWTYTGGGGGGYNPPVTYYTLRFETGGSDIPSVRETYNTYIDLTKYVPTWRGHTFIGWYTERSLMNKVSGVYLTKDMTVYAGWRVDENLGTGANPFTDVSEKDWFYGDVMFVYENGLMLGTSETLFSPHGTATRGMMATIFWRMEGSPAPKGKNSFTDVEAGKWYA